MPKNTQNEIRTYAYILKRTNYAEADRILNLITPSGKMVAIAKGVRKPKSKLAGGVEMFSLVDLNIHKGKSEFGVITSAKMLKYCGNILLDLNKMELAGMILKKVSLLSENLDNPEFFTIVDQSMMALDKNVGINLIETWFWLNLAKASGEEINLYRDTTGEKLREEEKYVWDNTEGALSVNNYGEIGVNEIKMMRLMLAVELSVVERVKNVDGATLSKILKIARAVNKC
ncbi:DNA repair protein RecO [Candidatus Saccharibacteria bacterium]|nr:DNA repair protein RecO [Candidatus Saccharibacteria bacterium]